MTAVNLRVSTLLTDDVTLYILDHSHKHKEMYTNINNTGLFSKVMLIKTKKFNKHWLQKYKITRYSIKAIEYLLYARITSKFIKDTTKYNQFWVSFMDRSSWLIFLTYKKRNKNLILNFFEDGIGSYQLLMMQQNKLDQKLSHLLGINTVFEEIQSLYLYQPSLVTKTLYPSIKKKVLPKISDFNNKKNLNKIFSFEANDIALLKYKIIFFDSPFSSNKINKKQLEIIDFFIETLKDSFCIKVHPATLLKHDKYSKSISNVHSSIEMLCLNTDVSQNVFISIMSTVGISPKLMFNQEPVVIYLYKLLNIDKTKFGEYFDFLEAFSHSYTKPNQFFIPESIQELKLILKNLNSNG